MSTALAKLAPAQLPSPTRAPLGVGLQTLEGCVSAFFALERYDRRYGVAIYALRVVNRTSSALICRTWVVSRSGGELLAHPALVAVAPRSTSLSHVPFAAATLPAFDRAIAEIAGEGVHCILEAPSPDRPKPRRKLAMAATATLIAGGILLLSAAALNAALPRISAFSLAPQTLAGTTVQAEYSVSGWGQLAYSVLAPDGRQIEGARLLTRSGAIPIAVPRASEPGAYTVQLVMSGALGTSAATRILNALVLRQSRAPSEAQIDAISITPAVAKQGQTVNVAYLASGDGGYVRLLGSDGTVWAQRPFSRTGTTQFVIPAVQDLREMRVQLHVTKGRSSAQSMAGLAISAQPQRESAGSPILSDDDPNQAAASSNASNGTFELLESTVKSGGDVHVRIISPRNGMRIALTDNQSHEVAEVDVASDATTVTLRAPVVTAAARYTIVATFTDGFGQESVVQPITVLP